MKIKITIYSDTLEVIEGFLIGLLFLLFVNGFCLVSCSNLYVIVSLLCFINVQPLKEEKCAYFDREITKKTIC